MINWVKKKLGGTTQIAIVVFLVLLAANMALSLVLMNQTRSMMKSLIRGRLMDIANTAADLLDGDSLEKLTAQDADTPAYQAALSALTVFQENIELEYIYGIRAEEDGSFTFTIDPAEDDPGEFGEPVVTTDALRKASLGTAAMDEVPYEDAWGRFYSAYSPVFDSQGRVAGIVGVDYSADWYEAQISRYTRSILVISLLSVIAGALIVLIVTRRIRQRFHELNDQLHGLAGDVDALMREVREDEKYKRLGQGAEDPSGTTGRGGIQELSQGIHSLHQEMRQYIDYVHAQAYTDAMTGVGNKTAYFEKVDRISSQIDRGTANFSIAVFDINGLKNANDNWGHEIGDQIIVDAAAVIKKVFGAENAYRIGGDEFIVLMERIPGSEMQTLFKRIDAALAEFNRGEKRYETDLAISKGVAVYDPGAGESFKQVFKRADEAMYRDKANFYIQHGDRRKR